MRILLTEGSGLTSRQVAGRLGTLGHEVEILSSTPLCLSRFTRHVRAVHAVPHFGTEPLAWLDAAERIARVRKIDLMFPTQEQVAIISTRKDSLAVPTIVPPFSALARVQDKVSAYHTLTALGLPQPETAALYTEDDLDRISKYPVFVKRPVSTASSGVLRAATRREVEDAARSLGLGTETLIAQSQADGPLAMVQAVADRGRLVAHHANLRLREGVGGGASLKESVTVPGLRDLLAQFAGALAWHGVLSMDIILGLDGPVVIDVNPRLVEPGNALASGVDLVAAMLDVAGASNPPTRRAPRARPPAASRV
jgi:glutathione synthase/RimK-type ligase-like ATP-grasp enzyme